MDMHPLHAGKLRAIGYDAGRRLLRVALDDGNALEYANVSDSVWRNFKQASAPWSYYRDNIEDAYQVTRGARTRSAAPASSGKNPLDDLFG